MADEQPQIYSGGASLQDLATNGNNLNKILSLLVIAVQNAFPRITGTFMMGAASTKVVADVNVTSTSVIMLMPTNATAGTLVAGANAPYTSARTPGVSFTLTTAAGGAAAGTETFSYILVNPS